MLELVQTLTAAKSDKSEPLDDTIKTEKTEIVDQAKTEKML